VKREKILALGSFQTINSFIDANTEVVDVEGRTFLPGFSFIECHHHIVLYQHTTDFFLQMPMQLIMIFTEDCTTIETIIKDTVSERLDKIKKRQQKKILVKIPFLGAYSGDRTMN